MANEQPIFSVRNEWCVENSYCGDIVLLPSRWDDHVIVRHPEVAPYAEQVKAALVGPNLLYRTKHVKPTLSFYARNLILDDPRYRVCYMAVFVRYQLTPACVWTAYLPSHLASDPGTLLYVDR